MPLGHGRPDIEGDVALPEYVIRGFQVPDAHLAEIAIWLASSLQPIVAPESIFVKEPCEDLQFACPAPMHAKTVF